MSSLSVDSSLPSFYRRGQAQRVTLPVYTTGSVPAIPTAGVFTLYDASKNVIVTGATSLDSDNVSYYDVQDTDLPDTLALSSEYQEEWEFDYDSSVVPGGTSEIFRRDAFLCLRLLHPVVSEPMLKRLVGDLDNLRQANLSSFQPYLDETWAVIQRTLLQSGKRPYLVMNAYDFADWHKHLALESIFMDFETYMGEGRYAKRAADHRALAERAYDSLKFEYDLTEQNKRTAASPSVGAVPVTYLNYGGSGFRSQFAPTFKRY